MIIQMTTYDSIDGDGLVFDLYVFSASTFDGLVESVVTRFEELLGNETLVLRQEKDFVNVVDARTGKTAETYLTAYLKEDDAHANNDGMLLANAVFYNPNTRELSCDFDAFFCWDLICDTPDDLLVEWGLSGILQNQPCQLDGNSREPSGGLCGLELVRFLFDLYNSQLKVL